MAVNPYRRKKDSKLVYRVKVRDPDGKWYPSLVFETEAEAKKYEAELIERKRKGQRNSMESRTNTMNDFWEVWSTQNRSDVSTGWRISQDQMYRDFIQPSLGGMRLMDIGKPDILEVLVRMKRRGKSDQLRKHVYSLMRRLFGDAIDIYELLADNPVKAKIHRPKVKRTERAFLSPEQAFQLLEYVRSHPYIGTPIWLQICSGMRVEAVIGLTWEAVQWDRDQILIKQCWKQKERRLLPYPKNGDWDYVPMPPELGAFLWTRWLVSGQNPEAFVCTNAKGDMLPYDTYNQALRRVCIEAGLPEVTTHELRHTCTEIYVQQGATMVDIQRLLNHRSASTSEKYMHRTDGRLSRIAGTLGLPGLAPVCPSECPTPGTKDRMGVNQSG